MAPTPDERTDRQGTMPLNREPYLHPMPEALSFSQGAWARHVWFTGVSVEGEKVWTNGAAATLTFRSPVISGDGLLMTFGLSAFTWPDLVPRQTVEVRAEGAVLANWIFVDREPTTRGLLLSPHEPGAEITLTFSVLTCARPAALGINADNRELGVAFSRLGVRPVADREKAAKIADSYGRRVGTEALKTYDKKLESGFWDKYVVGPNVLDIGFRGRRSGAETVVPIIEGAIGVDLDYPGYDGVTLPFPTCSQDAVFSSHCLEHIPHYVKAIQEWYRVTKVGGHLIIIVPHSFLYERKRTPPSRWNSAHHRFYTPSSLLAEIEQAMVPNTYRVRHLAENDLFYDYTADISEHPRGCYEIELVIEKIHSPAWRLDD